MVNRYLGKFSAEGKPEGFLLEGVNYKTPEQKAEKMAEGYVELTQEEWEYYTNNRGMGDNGTGYIRDPETGKPVSAPKRVYTKTELADIAYNQCMAVVDADENEIAKAVALGGQDDYVEELREEIAEAEAKYAQQLADIEAGIITEPEQLYDNTEEE
jgi:hypothetical protein